VHEDTEKHEAQYEEWKAALEICDCGAKFEEAVAAANDAFDAETARISKERDIAAEAKEDFDRARALEPNDPSIEKELRRLKQAFAQHDAKEKKRFAKMFNRMSEEDTVAEEEKTMALQPCFSMDLRIFNVPTILFW